MKILQNKTKVLATIALLFVMSMSFGQPSDFNPNFDEEGGGDGEEAPINDWILLSSLIAIGYGFYAIKKKSAVKA